MENEQLVDVAVNVVSYTKVKYSKLVLAVEQEFIKNIARRKEEGEKLKALEIEDMVETTVDFMLGCLIAGDEVNYYTMVDETIERYLKG